MGKKNKKSESETVKDRMLQFLSDEIGRLNKHIEKLRKRLEESDKS